MAVVTLKLLVNQQTKKVLYAEASKQLVDFLLGLMELPLGSILRLLHKSSQIGDLSLGKIYESARFLEDSYFQQNNVCIPVICPNVTPISHVNVKQTPILQELFPRTNNPGYNNLQNQKNEVDGYVKGAVVYMVMDDLTISPYSTISSIDLINTHGIKDIGNLREMRVQVDGGKALMLVRAAFQSSTVLTDVLVPRATNI